MGERLRLALTILLEEPGLVGHGYRRTSSAPEGHVRPGDVRVGDALPAEELAEGEHLEPRVLPPRRRVVGFVAATAARAKPRMRGAYAALASRLLATSGPN